MECAMNEMPDVKVMQDIEREMIRLYRSETPDMLPAVREELLDLTVLVKAGNDALWETGVSSLVSLNTDLDISLTALDEEDLLHSRASLQADMGKIASAIQQVRDYRSPDLVALRQKHHAGLAAYSATVETLKTELGEQQKRMDDMNELIDTLDHPSVQKALRRLIPEKDDVDAMIGLIKDPSVDVKLVKRVLDKFNNNLDLLEQGRKFSDLVAARKRLTVSLEQQKQVLQKTQQQLEKAQYMSEQFTSVDSLLGQREPWVAQASKFNSGWQALARKLDNATQPQALRSALESVRDYLVALRRCFEAA